MSYPRNESETRKTAQQHITAQGARENDFERIKKVVAQATDLRQERIEAAKRALKEGKLNLKGSDLAEKILADPLNQIDVEI